MARCKDCIHYDLCQYNAYQEAHYFGKDKEIYITINNNSVCKFFKNEVDVVEVKHGYWEQTEEPLGVRDVACVECSVCGESWIIDEDLSFEEQTQGWNYCLNCGAKMDGERSETNGE